MSYSNDMVKAMELFLITEIQAGNEKREIDGPVQTYTNLLHKYPVTNQPSDSGLENRKCLGIDCK